MDIITMPSLKKGEVSDLLYKSLKDKIFLFNTIAKDFAKDKERLLSKTGFELIQIIIDTLKDLNVDVAEANTYYLDHLEEFGLFCVESGE